MKFLFLDGAETSFSSALSTYWTQVQVRENAVLKNDTRIFSAFIRDILFNLLDFIRPGFQFS